MEKEKIQSKDDLIKHYVDNIVDICHVDEKYRSSVEDALHDFAGEYKNNIKKKLEEVMPNVY